MPMSDEKVLCQNADCGKPIVIIPGHRRRQYCDDACKQAAHRARLLAARQAQEEAERQERNQLIESLMLAGEQLGFAVLTNDDFRLEPGVENWLTFCDQAGLATLYQAYDIAHIKVRAQAARKRLVQLRPQT